MRRALLGMVVGAVVVWAGNSLYDVWQTSMIGAQAPENWLDIALEIPDVGPGQEPSVQATFSILRPVIIRTNISPRNVQTGVPLCQGRTSTAYPERTDPREVIVPLYALAGLEGCDWPPGKYVASITFTMTDLATNVQLKSLTMERDFEVRP